MDKEEWFKEIASQNDARLQRMCRYYVDGTEDRKDLFQEILTNIWKSLNSFKGDASVHTYVYRVAVNTCINFRGKLLKEQKQHFNWDPSILEAIAADNDHSDGDIKEAQLINLESELNVLSIIDKTLITLMLEGLSMKDISNIVGITEPNVKTKIHRIKHTLKTKLTAS
ncbi:MAG: RNA polymerase sigma factor [Reichenbachiella sp.]